MLIPEKLKKYALIIGGIAAALLVAFAFGRYTVPAKIVEKDVEKVVIVEKIDEKKLQELVEQNRYFREQLSELKKTIHREIRTLKHPSGLVEITKVEDINLSKVVKEREIQYVDRVEKIVETKYLDRAVEVIVEKIKVIDSPKPEWKLTPMVGVNLRDLTLGQGITTGPLTYGGMAERRIIGPIFGGIWGLSSGQAGVTVTVEF